MRVAICFMLLALTAPARAEWFADLYGGVAYTPRSDVTLIINRPGVSPHHTFHDVKWDNSTVLGVRAGKWVSDSSWYGVGLDLFQFRADIPTQMVDATIAGSPGTVALQAIDFSVTVIAFDFVRLRYPLLASPEHPAGRLQPYFNAGPAIFRIKVQNRGNGEFTSQSATTSSLGYKVGGGLSWRVTPGAAIFGEYRFTHVDSEANLTGSGTGFAVPVRFGLDTHHLVAGLSFSF